MDTLFRGNVDEVGLLSLLLDACRLLLLRGRLWKKDVHVPGACFGPGTSTIGRGAKSWAALRCSKEYLVSGSGGGPENPPSLRNCWSVADRWWLVAGLLSVSI